MCKCVLTCLEVQFAGVKSQASKQQDQAGSRIPCGDTYNRCTTNRGTGHVLCRQCIKAY